MKSQRCGYCEGSGKVPMKYQIRNNHGPDSFLYVREVCPVCKGHGFIHSLKVDKS